MLEQGFQLTDDGKYSPSSIFINRLILLRPFETEVDLK